MARRKRKQTLFDVMNKGSGFTPPTYATRAPRPGASYTPPTSKPTISSVIADWLQEKLQARRAANAERAKQREATRSQASAPARATPTLARQGRDELDAMRRELGAKPVRAEPEVVASALATLTESEPDTFEPAAPRRRALDALASMRAELATAVEDETSSAVSEVVDGVEETPAEPKPKRKGTIITSIFRSKSRAAMEAIEAPGAESTPARTEAQHITISSTAGADVRATPSIRERLTPIIVWARHTSARTSLKARELARSVSRRCTRLLDRVTTQNGHRIALGRYTPFIVGGAILFTVVLAFVFGQVFRPRQPSALDLAAREARDGVTRPDVIRPDGSAPKPRAGDPAPSVIDDNARSNVPAGNIVNPPSNTSLVRRWNDPQTVGENYIVVMSYTADADASATVEVLAKYGIGATVELNIPRYHGEGQPDRYYVVTTDGFASRGTYKAKVNGVDVERQFKELAKNPGYAALLQQIIKCNDAELKKTLPARLDPRPYKWEARPKRT